MTPTKLDDQADTDANSRDQAGASDGKEDLEEEEESKMDSDEREYWEVKKVNVKLEGKKWAKVWCYFYLIAF